MPASCQNLSTSNTRRRSVALRTLTAKHRLGEKVGGKVFVSSNRRLARDRASARANRTSLKSERFGLNRRSRIVLPKKKKKQDVSISDKHWRYRRYNTSKLAGTQKRTSAGDTWTRSGIAKEKVEFLTEAYACIFLADRFNKDYLK